MCAHGGDNSIFTNSRIDSQRRINSVWTFDCFFFSLISFCLSLLARATERVCIVRCYQVRHNVRLIRLVIFIVHLHTIHWERERESVCCAPTVLINIHNFHILFLRMRAYVCVLTKQLIPSLIRNIPPQCRVPDYLWANHDVYVMMNDTSAYWNISTHHVRVTHSILPNYEGSFCFLVVA